MGITAELRRQKHRTRLTEYARACRAVDDRDGKICRLCTAWVACSAHHHHLVPRSLGGPHSTSNLIRICGSCHAAIHAKRLHVTGDADGTLQTKREGNDDVLR